ncbi:serine hydrolase domain-containing protein [Brevundimonas goettingensis]|uniref:Serine hydrolase n=1 Tax=Brevundimonas goettingensis TaxID=2774190 RepID=A0A975BYG3_9CAUL|nr:serine hydrolase [Brevundimonas goettingensis]QTC89896.1 serine hydrolase [Brevundimonas goettingensis]
MTKHPLAAAAALAVLAVAPAACAAPLATGSTVAAEQTSPEMSDLLAYVQNHASTGFVVIQDGKVLIDKTWPAPTDAGMFSAFVYGRAADGELLEDVASQQKSFVSILVAAAIDKGLLDINKPVSDYLGQGWSKASPEQEAAIKVIDVLNMSSGLNEQFGYVAPSGTVFFYNTPVYAMTKAIVAAAAHQPLEALTRDWLTGPTGMTNTEWRQRPAALASVGNATGLVTTPHDVARFGEMVLHDGVAADGTRVVSSEQLHALFNRASTNPAYGRLWWLNGGAYTMRAAGARRDGQLIEAAPADLVGALGAFDRRLYVVPSRKLVVVRTGAATNETDFDQQLWLRLMKVIG